VVPLELFTGDFIGILLQQLELHVYGAVNHFVTNLITSFSSYLVFMPPVVFEDNNVFCFVHNMAGSNLPFKVIKTEKTCNQKFVIFAILPNNWTETMKGLIKEQLNAGIEVFVVWLDHPMDMNGLDIHVDNIFTIPSYLLSATKGGNAISDIQLHKLLRKAINCVQDKKTIQDIKVQIGTQVEVTKASPVKVQERSDSFENIRSMHTTITPSSTQTSNTSPVIVQERSDSFEKIRSMHTTITPSSTPTSNTSPVIVQERSDSFENILRSMHTTITPSSTPTTSTELVSVEGGSVSEKRKLWLTSSVETTPREQKVQRGSRIKSVFLNNLDPN